MAWVKVRGHSKNRGNDRADAAATKGMNGFKEHVLEVAEYVNDFMGRMAWCTDTTDAAHEPNVLDAISAGRRRPAAAG